MNAILFVVLTAFNTLLPRVALKEMLIKKESKIHSSVQLMQLFKGLECICIHTFKLWMFDQAWKLKGQESLGG